MKCPNCNSHKTTVVDSRKSTDDTMRRRRHKCSRGHSFSTYETYATSEVWKNDNQLVKIQDAMQPLMVLLRKLPMLEDKR